MIIEKEEFLFVEKTQISPFSRKENITLGVVSSEAEKFCFILRLFSFVTSKYCCTHRAETSMNVQITIRIFMVFKKQNFVFLPFKIFSDLLNIGVVEMS